MGLASVEDIEHELRVLRRLLEAQQLRERHAEEMTA